jgi:EXS family
MKRKKEPWQQFSTSAIGGIGNSSCSVDGIASWLSIRKHLGGVWPGLAPPTVVSPVLPLTISPRKKRGDHYKRRLGVMSSPASMGGIVGSNSSLTVRHHWQLLRKLSLVILLLISLYLISDHENNNTPKASVFRSRRGVLGALARHEPSLRIFRALCLVNLLLWCSAAALYFWDRQLKSTDAQMIGTLLFSSPALRQQRHRPRYRRQLRQSASSSDAEGGGPLHERNAIAQDPAQEERAALVDTVSLPKPQGAGRAPSSMNAVAGALTTGDGLKPRSSLTRSSSTRSNDSEHLHTEAPTSAEFLHRRYKDKSDDEISVDDGSVDGNDSCDGDVDDSDEAGRGEIADFPIAPPSPMDVANAAVDMLLLILLALFGFTLSSNSGTTISPASPPAGSWFSLLWTSPGRAVSQIAAPVFPLVLFVAMTIQCVVPWRSSRGPFWVVIGFTVLAPWHEVTFRDGFLGDVLTSSVRPLQDIAFTWAYLIFGLRGWWSSSYHDRSFLDQADANVPTLERSWLVHTVVLPMCMISPLYVRV